MAEVSRNFDQLRKIELDTDFNPFINIQARGRIEIREQQLAKDIEQEIISISKGIDPEATADEARSSLREIADLRDELGKNSFGRQALGRIRGREEIQRRVVLRKAFAGVLA